MRELANNATDPGVRELADKDRERVNGSKAYLNWIMNLANAM